MKPHALRSFNSTTTTTPLHVHVDHRAHTDNHLRLQISPENHAFRVTPATKRRHVSVSDEVKQDSIARWRDVLVTPLIAIGACVLRSAVARADDRPAETATAPPAPDSAVKAVEEGKAEVINSRIYDATVIGEPMAVGKDKGKVWEKLMNARIVFLGEAEQVPTRDDKELELEISKSLRKMCTEVERPISLALEAFPSNIQEQLDKFMDGRIDGEVAA